MKRWLMQQEARPLAVACKLEYGLVWELVCGLFLVVMLRSMVSGTLHPVSSDLTASNLVASGCQHEFVVHAFAEDHFADDYFPLAVNFAKNLSIVVVEYPARRVKVLLISQNLVYHIFIFDVSLEIYLVQSGEWCVILDAGQAMRWACALVGKGLICVIFSCICASLPGLTWLFLALRYIRIISTWIRLHWVSSYNLAILVNLHWTTFLRMSSALLNRIRFIACERHTVSIWVLSLARKEFAIFILFINSWHIFNAKVVNRFGIVCKRLRIHCICLHTLLIRGIPWGLRLSCSLPRILITLRLYPRSSLFGLLIGTWIYSWLLYRGLGKVCWLNVCTGLRVELRPYLFYHSFSLLLKSLPLQGYFLLSEGHLFLKKLPLLIHLPGHLLLHLLHLFHLKFVHLQLTLRPQLLLSFSLLFHLLFCFSSLFSFSV